MKNIDLLIIGSTKAFLPLSNLLIVYLVSVYYGSDTLSSVSFVIAAAQIISQIDGGAPSFIMSTVRCGDMRMLRNGLNYYFQSGLLWKTLILAVALFVNYLLREKYLESIFIIYMLAISYSAFNVASTVLIKEGFWIGLFIYELFIILMSLPIVYTGRLVEMDAQLLVGFLFSIPIIFGLIPYYFFAKYEECKVSKKHAGLLQYSQISSSVISNKEYILLHAFSMHNESAIYSLIGRLMFLPMQVTSVYISRLWLSLDGGKGIRKDKLAKHLCSAAVVTAILSIPIVIYLKYKSADGILLSLLFVLNIANSISGVMSAYSSTKQSFIPSVIWFSSATLFLFAICMLLYLLFDWRLSIVLTSFYFIILSFYLRRKIKF